MVENTLQKLVSKAYEAYQEGSRVGSRLLNVRLSVKERVVQRSVRRALMVLGFGLGFLVLAFEDCWVTDSPLFTVVGSAASLLFLVLCWTAGGLWWLVTGNKQVYIWAKDLLPFCVQPYRSIAGIPAVFMVLAPLYARLLRVFNHLPWIERHWQGFLIWSRLLLWLLTIGIWLIAIWLNIAGS